MKKKPGFCRMCIRIVIGCLLPVLPVLASSTAFKDAPTTYAKKMKIRLPMVPPQKKDVAPATPAIIPGRKAKVSRPKIDIDRITSGNIKQIPKDFITARGPITQAARYLLLQKEEISEIARYKLPVSSNNYPYTLFYNSLKTHLAVSGNGQMVAVANNSYLMILHVNRAKKSLDSVTVDPISYDYSAFQAKFLYVNDDGTRILIIGSAADAMSRAVIVEKEPSGTWRVTRYDGNSNQFYIFNGTFGAHSCDRSLTHIVSHNPRLLSQGIIDVYERLSANKWQTVILHKEGGKFHAASISDNGAYIVAAMEKKTKKGGDPIITLVRYEKRKAGWQDLDDPIVTDLTVDRKDAMNDPRKKIVTVVINNTNTKVCVGYTHNNRVGIQIFTATDKGWHLLQDLLMPEACLAHTMKLQFLNNGKLVQIQAGGMSYLCELRGNIYEIIFDKKCTVQTNYAGTRILAYSNPYSTTLRLVDLFILKTNNEKQRDETLKKAQEGHQTEHTKGEQQLTANSQGSFTRKMIQEIYPEVLPPNQPNAPTDTALDYYGTTIAVVDHQNLTLYHAPITLGHDLSLAQLNLIRNIEAVSSSDDSSAQFKMNSPWKLPVEWVNLFNTLPRDIRIYLKEQYYVSRPAKEDGNVPQQKSAPVSGPSPSVSAPSMDEID